MEPLRSEPEKSDPERLVFLKMFSRIEQWSKGVFFKSMSEKLQVSNKQSLNFKERNME